MDARLEPYRVVVSFLGEALGPDYEVVLHDLTSEDGTIVAIVNNHISGRTEGAPLSNMALRFIQERMYEKQDYLAGYQGASQAKGRLRSSTMFIKDNGQLIGMLCINFDAGKYSRIAQELLARHDICVEYMPQAYEELLDFSMTPVEFLAKTGDKDELTMIRTYLGSLKYTIDEMEHPISELSGGQRAKVLLLKMNLSRANVLILDEPTRNFSPLSGPMIRKVIRDFPGAVISISHDRKYISEVCDKVYRLTASGLEEVDLP